MFMVDDATAGAICRAYEDSGDLGAVVEVRRQFPLIQDGEHARACVRMIIGWKPVPPPEAARPPGDGPR